MRMLRDPSTDTSTTALPNKLSTCNAGPQLPPNSRTSMPTQANNGTRYMDVNTPFAVARHCESQQRDGQEANQPAASSQDRVRGRYDQAIGVQKQLECECGT